MTSYRDALKRARDDLAAVAQARFDSTRQDVALSGMYRIDAVLASTTNAERSPVPGSPDLASLVSSLTAERDEARRSLAEYQESSWRDLRAQVAAMRLALEAAAGVLYALPKSALSARRAEVLAQCRRALDDQRAA